MGLVAMLDGLPDDRDAGGGQKLAQLGEVVARLQRGDDVGALLGAGGWGEFCVAPLRVWVVRPLRLRSMCRFESR